MDKKLRERFFSRASIGKEKRMETKETQLLRKTGVVCLLAMICCLLWGSAFPCIKTGYRWLHIDSQDTASQILFAGYRFTLAGVLTVLLGSALARKWLFPRKESWGMIGKLAMLQTVIQYLFFYVGVANTSGVKASIIGGSHVFISILLSGMVFHMEKVTKAKWLGCFLGFAGVVLINLTGEGLGGGFLVIGEGFIFLSSLSYALSSVFMKQYSQRENPVVLSGYQFILGGLIMIGAGSAFGGEVRGFTPASAALLVYMALISAVAYSLWGILLKYNPVAKVTIFGFMNPMFGVILSALILGESNQAFTLQGLLALVLVCLGIFLVNRSEEPRNA